jgi:hypothetical protein
LKHWKEKNSQTLAHSHLHNKKLWQGVTGDLELKKNTGSDLWVAPVGKIEIFGGL